MLGLTGGTLSAPQPRGSSVRGGYEESSKTHTLSPTVTGSSVVGIKYRDGVMLAADTLASYGSQARFKDISRLSKVNDACIIGAGGEISDFQAILHLLEEEIQGDINRDDGFTRSPKEIFSLLRAVMYDRRNKFNPLYNSLLVAGINKGGDSFLGSVDHIGTSFCDDIIATGFGAHIAIPILRRCWKPDMTEGEARGIIEDCMRVLFYRDCRALNRIQISKVSSEGALVSEPFIIQTSWDIAGSSAIPKNEQESSGSLQSGDSFL